MKAPTAQPSASEAEYEVYLRRAAEVEAIAAGMPFELDRDALLRIAADWRALAQNAMRRSGAASKTS